MADRTDGFYVGTPWGGVIFIEDLATPYTDTQTHVQLPVNVVLAEKSMRDPKSRLKEPGVMTKSMMNKIFKE